ncbi:Alpha/beta hydrolase fold-1 [Apiospora phragmitis]|uniref:Alpha/beta hydrolase fold-1 n=1 Tax=Apiospora phragmitis TaxID=2905665 RepID=A0ABR1VR37_9PEZI
MSKPFFVPLHGAWHTSKCFTPLISALVVCPALPSSNATPLPKDWNADVEAIQTTVSKLVEEHDVVVVMHSFSGLTGGTSLEGLDKQSCTAKGFTGGVIRLVYIAAFLVPEGFQHSPAGTRDNMVPQMKTDMDVRGRLLSAIRASQIQAGSITILPEDAKDMFYQDVDDATSAKLAKDLQAQSLGAYWCKTTFAAWRYIPTTYIICKRDVPTTVAAIHWLIDTAKASGPHKIDCVIEVDAGHSPFVSKPQWLADTLLAEANRGL